MTNRGIASGCLVRVAPARPRAGATSLLPGVDGEIFELGVGDQPVRDVRQQLVLAADVAVEGRGAGAQSAREAPHAERIRGLLGHLAHNVADERDAAALSEMVSDAYRCEGSIYALFSTVIEFPLTDRRSLYRDVARHELPPLLPGRPTRAIG